MHETQIFNSYMWIYFGYTTNFRLQHQYSGFDDTGKICVVFGISIIAAYIIPCELLLLIDLRNWMLFFFSVWSTVLKPMESALELVFEILFLTLLTWTCLTLIPQYRKECVLLTLDSVPTYWTTKVALELRKTHPYSINDPSVQRWETHGEPSVQSLSSNHFHFFAVFTGERGQRFTCITLRLDDMLIHNLTHFF